MPAKPAPKSAADDHRERLERLRDQLAAAIETCSENMLPQLSGQYRATLESLAQLAPTAVARATVRDQLKERREQQRTGGRPAPKKAAAPKAARG